MNSKCGVQSKRKCGSQESCVCIVGFPACGCQKKSVVYGMDCRHAAVQSGTQWDWYTIRVGHSGTGDTMRMGHRRPDWDTKGTGTHWDSGTMGFRQSGTSTQ